MTDFANLGVDIGGTFTDVVLETPSGMFSTKVLTTYAAPEDAILDGMAQVCAKAGVTPAALTRIIHGTTLATNALIERRGARTAFITTEGFRDVIEMRTESRFEQYDLNLTLPDPLIPRDARLTLRERVDAGGNILIPLAQSDIETLAHHLDGYDSVAVGFLHSYLNPAHERLVRDVLARLRPGLSVSLSSDVSPQMREYERFNTTCANAYVRPMMESYLSRLAARLADHGATCPIFLIHSGGGIISLEAASQFPVRLVESGPAGGAIFAADIARRHGLEKVLSFDMGGTTAKICLIRDGQPKTARVFEVARSYRFKKGSGMPISIPVIDMVEIGAGGGSIAHLDAMRQIRVGPESAASEPGPACYQRGGTRPAVTDADLTLGRLDPTAFAGGAIPLDPALSAEALTTHIGQPLSLDPITAAYGVAEVVDENMANAARVHAVENGEDLADYTMIAFGGAAPLHAGRLCEKLGITRLLVPPGAGVGSAIGFLRAPSPSRRHVRSICGWTPSTAPPSAPCTPRFWTRRLPLSALATPSHPSGPPTASICVTRGRAGKSPSPSPTRLSETPTPPPSSRCSRPNTRRSLTERSRAWRSRRRSGPSTPPHPWPPRFRSPPPRRRARAHNAPRALRRRDRQARPAVECPAPRSPTA